MHACETGLIIHSINYFSIPGKKECQICSAPNKLHLTSWVISPENESGNGEGMFSHLTAFSFSVFHFVAAFPPVLRISFWTLTGNWNHFCFACDLAACSLQPDHRFCGLQSGCTHSLFQSLVFKFQWSCNVLPHPQIGLQDWCGHRMHSGVTPRLVTLTWESQRCSSHSAPRMTSSSGVLRGVLFENDSKTCERHKTGKCVLETSMPVIFRDLFGTWCWALSATVFLKSFICSHNLAFSGCWT